MPGLYRPESLAAMTIVPGLRPVEDEVLQADRRTPGASPVGMAVPAAVVVGMTAAAVYQKGAFYPLDAFGVVVVSLVLVAVALRRERERAAVVAAATLLGLAAWWMIRAVGTRGAVEFLPLGASFLGFLAAFLVCRRLTGDDSSRVGSAVVAIGALSATAGVAGVLWHWHPLAQKSGHFWQVATTLTYPAAAAVLCSVALLVAMALDIKARLVRAAVCLCLAGLVGTQSHWDLLALGAGVVMVPPRRWVSAWWPLVTGVLAGTVVVAAGAGHTGGWTGRVALVAIVVASSVRRTKDARQDGGGWRSRLVMAGGLAAVAGGIVVLTVLAPFDHEPRQPAGQSQTQAWSASADAFGTEVLAGVGPPRIATSGQPVATYPGFAADGYLSVIADGGLVGIALLLGAGGAVAARFRRRDLISSCAAGAAVTFAVAGAVDFDWQLPALALLGGCVAGLAAQADRPATDLPLTPSTQTQTQTQTRRRPPAASLIWVVGVVAALTAQLLVGSAHTAGGVVASGPKAKPTAQISGANTPPVPAPNADAPGRTIYNGADDATDPFMLTIGGRYYLYASEGETFMNVPLRIATRLGHWGSLIDVLPQLPAWAEGGLTWAPDVQKVRGGWALYFTSLVRGMNPATHCIGSAFSRSPQGPFVANPHPFICQLDHRGSIHARVVTDGGSLVMLWKSDDNANPSVPGPDQGGYTGIYAQDLSADGKTLLGAPFKILSPSEPWEGTIIEAPDMIKAWGTYWLFFSANWYDSTLYGIGVAACDSPLGPCADTDPQPFLGSNLQGLGPGESSLFEDGNAVYVLYNPFKANDPGPVIPRPVSMARIGFTPEGPYLALP
jgi:hypothetical protein